MFQGASSVLGQHYYVENAAGNATLPKWDFTSAAFNGDETAFVIGAKMGDIPAPAGNQTDVDWVSLTNMGGSLASMVFRVDTLGGQPPAAVCYFVSLPYRRELTSIQVFRLGWPSFCQIRL